MSILCHKRNTFCKHLANTLLIKHFPIEIPSCFFYKCNNRKCVVSKSSSNCCSKCVCYMGFYNIYGLPIFKIERIVEELDCVCCDYKKTLVYLNCLNKQEEELGCCAKEILCYSLKTIDKLNILEKVEKAATNYCLGPNPMLVSVVGPSNPIVDPKMDSSS